MSRPTESEEGSPAPSPPPPQLSMQRALTGCDCLARRRGPPDHGGTTRIEEGKTARKGPTSKRLPPPPPPPSAYARLTRSRATAAPTAARPAPPDKTSPPSRRSPQANTGRRDSIQLEAARRGAARSSPPVTLRRLAGWSGLAMVWPNAVVCGNSRAAFGPSKEGRRPEPKPADEGRT